MAASRLDLDKYEICFSTKRDHLLTTVALTNTNQLAFNAQQMARGPGGPGKALYGEKHPWKPKIFNYVNSKSCNIRNSVNSV